MRLIVLMLTLTLGLGACADDGEERAATEAALDEASVTVQAQTITASFIEMAATAPSGSTPQTRAEELADAVGKLLNCGTATAVDTVVTISFGDPGCEVRERQLWGTVTIDVAGDDDGAIVTLTDVTDGGVTVAVVLTVTWDASGIRTVEHVGTVVINADSGLLFRVGGSQTQTPTAEGVRLSGSRCAVLDSDDVDCWTNEGLEACLDYDVDCRVVVSVSTDLTWTLPIAQSGAHRVTLASRGRDRQVDLSYTRESDAVVVVDAEIRNVGDTQPRSTFQFDVFFP